ncbi:MAG: PDZ domain-containing protein [Gemmatimonadetes bacterium]|nr:PDZ domain-containing protein [Gemmatimonadota bacterium]MYE69909.1 PDZ domain-containing protein [Gemmatimonadota bacterium]MYJ67686.1 PDZ domain-containing protein [Gemmatimonadota bacterium]
MKVRSLLLPGAGWALILGGALSAGLPGTVHAQDSLRVGEPALWIGVKTDTARVVVPATGEATLVIRVTGIQQGGPADLGGVLLGDVLVALNGRELVNYDVWLNSLAVLGPSQPAHLKLNRAGMELETTVIVADRIPPSFAARLDLPDFDSAWAALVQDFEALIETLPDTLGSRLVLSGSLRGAASFQLDSSGVSLTLTDTSATLDIRSADDSARIDRVPAVPEESVIVGRLRTAERANLAGRIAAEAERALTPDSSAFLRAAADSDLVVQPTPPSRAMELSRSGPQVVLLSAVVLGGAQVRTLSSALGRYFDVSSGVLIFDVLANSPARRAGFRPGDVIVAVEGREVATLAQLRNDLVLAELPVRVTVIRHGESIELTFPVR